MSRFAGLPTALGLRSEDPETKTGKVFGGSDSAL